MKTALLWFRQDLRLHDNTALYHAVQAGYNIIPVYILDNDHAGPWKMGGASRWWLHQSLQALNGTLENCLVFRTGAADSVLFKLLEDTKAEAVFWNRCYEPWRTERDTRIKSALKARGINVSTYKDALLWEPWEILKSDGTPYKVFTPFYRKGCLGHSEPAQPIPQPSDISLAAFADTGTLDALGLMPAIPWHKGFEQVWTPGEAGARQQLDRFIENGLDNYKDGRNRPDRENVSRLSPHLHFGEISPRLVWHHVRDEGLNQHLEKDTDHFCSELGWREFSYSLLHYNPDLPVDPLQNKFKNFPWRKPDSETLGRWQRGQTGIPIVDAGMRQLWHTGWMHNRVRMIVASFLIKNMMIDWREGEKWFWDCLVDADLANNAASWQWVAGCGADAAPYFRIFNPVTQSEKFDPEGCYIRQYVSELSDFPLRGLHAPWESDNPPANYPPPLVDLKTSRTDALAAFQNLKNPL